MKFLITGAAGFIGYHLSSNLLSQKYKVVAVDDINSYYDIKLKKHRIKLLKKDKNKINFSFIKLDLQNKKKLKHIFKQNNFDFVIHLAAQAGVRFSIDRPEEYIKSNVIGFFNLLEIIRYTKTKLIFASSSSVYGKTKQNSFSESQKNSEPLQLYAATKSSNELMAYAYHSLYNLCVIGLRFFTVYGPLGRPDMAVYKFSKKIVQNKNIKLFNRGHHSRDFTYISDVVECILKCVNKYKNKKEKIYQIFNVANGKPEKITYLINLLSKEFNKKARLKPDKLQMGDMINTKASINKTKRFLKFKPKVKLNEGVKEFVNWFKKYHKI